MTGRNLQEALDVLHQYGPVEVYVPTLGELVLTIESFSCRKSMREEDFRRMEAAGWRLKCGSWHQST